MFVRLLRDWRRFKAGRVIEPTGGAADILIRRGIAELVKENVEPTHAEPGIDRRPPKKRRGR